MEHIHEAEQWREIPGWEGLYEVSDLGRVRSVQRPGCRGKALATFINPKGYRCARLYDTAGNRRKGYTVHRLVCEAFLGERPAGQIIRHLNGDPLDSRLVNLAYGTYTDNAQDALRHGTQFPACRDACKHGHEYTPENTRIRTQGNCTFRVCRTCVREHSKAAEARKKARKQQQRR